jgi:hypothetical protein
VAFALQIYRSHDAHDARADYGDLFHCGIFLCHSNSSADNAANATTQARSQTQLIVSKNKRRIQF